MPLSNGPEVPNIKLTQAESQTHTPIETRSKLGQLSRAVGLSVGLAISGAAVANSTGNTDAKQDISSVSAADTETDGELCGDYGHILDKHTYDEMCTGRETYFIEKEYNSKSAQVAYDKVAQAQEDFEQAQEDFEQAQKDLAREEKITEKMRQKVEKDMNELAAKFRARLSE